MTTPVPASSPLANAQVHLVENLEDAEAMKRWASERRDGPLCVDTESSGRSPYLSSSVLRLIQLGDKQHGWVVPFEGRGWGGAAMEIIEAYEGEFAYHNAPHDLKWLMLHAGYDPPWSRIHNTMTIAHLDDPTRPRGLKPLSDRIVDPRSSAGQHAMEAGMSKQGWTWATVPLNWQPYWVYAGLDTICTAHVFDKLAPSVLSQFALPYDIERTADRNCVAMMNHGALLDVPWVERALPRLRDHAQEIRQWLRTYHGITSPFSSDQIARATEALDIPVLARTDSGKPQFDKAAMLLYSNMFPGPCADLMGALREVRKTEKVTGTYLENFLRLLGTDGRVHPSLWVCEAKTSRMTCPEPNLQNLNRDEKIVRGSFIPAPGYVFLSIDACQIEARLGAHFSQDPGLIEAFRIADTTGLDFYTAVGREIYRDSSMAKADPRRQLTKSVVLAKQFGSGAATMAATAGIPVDQMQVFLRMLNQRYPGLDAMMARTIMEGRAHPHLGRPAVYLPTGRRLLADAAKAYTLANFRIQGHAAEILKTGAARLEAIGLGPYMVMPVHDEFLLEVPEGQVEEIARAALAVLEDRDNYLVPITWEAEIMRERWAK